jgi:predicted kinase
MNWKFKYYDISSGVDWVSLKKDCPWFSEMEAISQDKIWHAEGNVQIHTKMVCDALVSLSEFDELSDQEKHIMVTAALMHDIEKRSTTIEEEKNGRLCITAPRHAKKGEKTTRELLYKEFNCPYHIRETICKIVRWHGKPLHVVYEQNLINISTQVPIHYLSMFAKADILGRICGDADLQLFTIECFEFLAQELDCLKSPRKFNSSLSQYAYLNSKEPFLDYEPYDETKFEVILMSALPGAGKDTYIRNNYKDWNVISIDDIRTELNTKTTNKRGNGQSIQMAKERAKVYMRKHENFIWNATNITKQMRQQLISLFESYGGRVRIIYLEAPYSTIIKQNNSREEIVPRNVIDNMIYKLEPPIAEEAHMVEYHIY